VKKEPQHYTIRERLFTGLTPVRSYPYTGTLHGAKQVAARSQRNIPSILEIVDAAGVVVAVRHDKWTLSPSSNQ
jgi:hypothetical protein